MSKIILTGVPADAVMVAKMNELLVADGHKPWTAKVDYTVMPCDQCGAGVWIGPRQRAVREIEGPETAVILCAAHAHEYVDEHGINGLGHLGGGDGASRT